MPKDTLSGESHEQDCDPRIFVDEATVEVREPEEGLDILHLVRFGPVLNNLDFVRSHRKTFGR